MKKMKKLASIINPMNKEKSIQDNEGIGFAKFASPKKGNMGASVGIDGFAQIVNKNKHSRSANFDEQIDLAQVRKRERHLLFKCIEGVNGLNKKKRSRPANAGDEDGYAPISQKSKEGLEFTMKTTEKASFTDKKYFVWRLSDAVIYQGWLANAQRKYSEICCVARSSWEKHEQPDNRISRDVLLSWIEFWKIPNFQKKSEIQKNNRSSRVDGHLSTHTSGSTSHRTVAARMKMKYQCDPTVDQIFLLTHLKNPNIKKIMCGEDGEDAEDGEDEENGENFNDERIWIDKKSQLTYEKFERLCEEQVKAGRPIDKNALFLEAAGGFDKKKRVYGVGSSQNLFYRSETVPCSSSFEDEENHRLQEEVKAMKDQMKAMQEQIAKILKVNSFRHAQSPSTDVDSDNGDE